MIVYTIAARLAIVLFLAVAATVPATGTAAAESQCQNIGNGDFCMNVDSTGEQTILVSMWYRKDFGEPTTVRLAYWFYAGDTFRGSWQPVSVGEVASWQDSNAPYCAYGKLEIQGGPVFYLEKNPVCPG